MSICCTRNARAYRYVAGVCCSVLQCVAVCCSVLQCVAVCCSVLQCLAVCCSVMQGVMQSVLHEQTIILQVFDAVCCRVCCSVCCRVCCSVCCTTRPSESRYMLQFAAVRRGVCCTSNRKYILQGVAVCCGVLLCVLQYMLHEQDIIS